MDILNRKQFLKHLRDALNHLHDPNRLRRSPLAALFGVANRFDTPSALQRILTEAIEFLEPKANEPSHSRAWRIYDALFYYYVQQFNQQEVADQLGISARQLRREQTAALETLAFQLWEQFDLETKLREDAGVETASAQVAATSLDVSEELAWLKDIHPEKPTDLNEALSTVLELARPHANWHGVSLEITVPAVLDDLSVHPVALNQILLNLLGVVVHQASDGRVSVSVRPLRWEVEVRVECNNPSSPTSISTKDASSLDVAQQLVDLCRCRLDVTHDDDIFSAALVLPAHEQLPVLAIDDNVDTLRMLQRYTSGTRYYLVGTQDPEKSLSLAERISPQIIVLDLMMPQVDGWRVLGRLRQHPLTERVPVVVCSILDQEELARSLGASGFVCKPITRQAFLAALDQQVDSMEPERR